VFYLAGIGVFILEETVPMLMRAWRVSHKATAFEVIDVGMGQRRAFS